MFLKLDGFDFWAWDLAALAGSTNQDNENNKSYGHRVAVFGPVYRGHLLYNTLLYNKEFIPDLLQLVIYNFSAKNRRSL